MTKLQQFTALAGGLFLLSACGGNSPTFTGDSAPSMNLLQTAPAGPLCSQLDFQSYSWPSGLFQYEKEGFQIALNIAGSFEGKAGWQNLANDFDQMGMSLGLLQQNLGSGTLQPLLLKNRDQNKSALNMIFSPAHLNSLLEMLKTWEGQLGKKSKTFLSSLDLDAPAAGDLQSESSDPSVLWARKNLYARPGQFDSVWQQELINLGGSPTYIGLQIESAWSLHEQALELQKWLGVRELRAYLLMFDIVVQNGGLKPEDRTDYLKYILRHPFASSTERLTKIVNLRLRWVRPQYRADVLARKMSLIQGHGVVHGKTRNYESEFCFNRLQSFRP